MRSPTCTMCEGSFSIMMLASSSSISVSSSSDDEEEETSSGENARVIHKVKGVSPGQCTKSRRSGPLLP